MTKLESMDHIYCVTTWETLVITGRDAADLLNRLLTINVKQLQVGEGDLTFLLDHRGRVQQAFWLTRLSSLEFRAVVDAGVQNLLNAIDHFIFSEQVELSPLDQHCLYMSQSGKAQEETLTSEHVNLQLYGFAKHEQLWWVQADYLKQEQAKLKSDAVIEITELELEQHRIVQGSASPWREYRDVGSPLDVSRRGITEGKGCYPGQEVIERTIALGQPARVTFAVMLNLETVQSDVRSQLSTLYLQGEKLMVFLEGSSDEEETKSIGLLTSLSMPTQQQAYGLMTIRRRAADETSWYLNVDKVRVTLSRIPRD